MPRSHRPPPAAQRPASSASNAAEPKPEGGSLATTFKIFLLFAGLMVKVPVGLYFSCKLLLFQSLLLLSPDDSGFYATIVAVVGLHVVLSVFVFIVWKEGWPDWRENKDE
uniref:Vacuolar ATPase assembly integral membrane protein vma21 n=1 Tax=Equus caballus TaxID=9796 RepID=A0A3Q2KLP6_HORSE